MCKRTKSVLCAAAALVLALSGISGSVSFLPLTEDISASAEVSTGKCGDNVSYELNDGVLTIYGTGDMYNYNYGLSPWMFDSNKITDVVIESGVTSVGDSAFYGFSKLKNVSLAGSVTSIGNYAFCVSGLKSISIPGTVSVISEGAFSGCGSLEKVVLGSGVSEIGNEAFSGCLKLKDVEFPSSIIEVGSSAFSLTEWQADLKQASGNDHLAIVKGFLLDGSGASGAVSIPSGVKNICGAAFSNCTGITSVTLLSGLEAVGDYAFENCTALTAVNFNSDLTELGAGAFANCKALKSVALPNGLNGLSYGVFSGCSSLSAVTFGNKVSHISGNAFRDCKALKSIELPEGLISIAEYAFNDCTSLENISFPETVESIGTTAFESTKWFTNKKHISPVIIVNKIVVSGKSAKGLVVLPQGTMTISDNAFAGAAGITGVIMPESIAYIGEGAFLDCPGMTSVTIPSGVSSIGDAAFGFATKKLTGEPAAVNNFTVRCVANTEGARYASESGLLSEFYNNDGKKAVVVKSAAAEVSPANFKVTLYENGKAVKTVVPDANGVVDLSSIKKAESGDNSGFEQDGENGYEMVISCPDFASIAPITLPY